MIFAAGCYAVALLLELLQFTWKRSNLPYWAAVVGCSSHAGLLAIRHLSDPRFGGAAMFFFASALGVAVIYAGWRRTYPDFPLGLVMLPIILLLMGGGFLVLFGVPEAVPVIRSPEKMLHAVPAAGVITALSVSCVCCLFYFLESYLLHKKYSMPMQIKLPSLEWSLSCCRRSCFVAFVCLCLCVLGGIALNFSRRIPSFWYDPLILGSIGLFALLLFGPLQWICQPQRAKENRFVFMCIISAFLIFFVILLIALITGNAHWNKHA